MTHRTIPRTKSQRARRELFSPAALALGATLAFAACSADTPSANTEPANTEPANTEPTNAQPGRGPQGFSSAKLSFFGDCPALLDYMQTEAFERVTAWGFGGGYYSGEGDVMMQATDAAA